ncbi:MAG: Methyltransferase type 11 [Candidatus Levybacteria bacterium GW2011_GWA2_36_13]|nr:MAG: Methyltransferase type 11 [Candidatus Levybacteria bacterium GW2011_GWA2_36_13]KKR72903.1 MAG: Methyltransferase type 11 [Candidatus Levybacteria bacterium GW2011_GWC2_40_7]
MAKDVKLSREKWDAEYKKTVDKDKARSLKKNFKNIYLSSTMSYIEKLFDSYKNKKYLEIGCGPFFIGQEIATKGAFVVGIDYSMNALKLAKFYLDEEGIDNYLLVCGDIAKMPFKDNVFDILYGGGVIEHFKDTVGVVKENHRVLKKGGVAFNSVPKLNLGSLTYRQMWGNIPSAPVLKQIAEFVHIKILKGKRMIYGYEYSFTDSQLRKIFAKAGFRRENIDVGRYEVPLLLEYIKNKSARKIAMAVAQSNLFWPATYILSRK